MRSCVREAGLNTKKHFFLIICVFFKARSIAKGGYLLNNCRDIGWREVICSIIVETYMQIQRTMHLTNKINWKPAHAHKPNSKELRLGGPQVWDRLALHLAFQVHLSYTARPHLRNKIRESWRDGSAVKALTGLPEDPLIPSTHTAAPSLDVTPV